MGAGAGGGGFAAVSFFGAIGAFSAAGVDSFFCPSVGGSAFFGSSEGGGFSCFSPSNGSLGSDFGSAAFLSPSNEMGQSICR